MSNYTRIVNDEDYSDVTPWGGEGGGPILPPGDYVFDVVSVEEAISRSNNDTYRVTFRVVDGEHEGKEITNSYSRSPKAKGRIAALLVACGAPLKGFDSDQVIGSRMRASVIHRNGDKQFDPSGNEMPARVFANIANERPYQDKVEAAPPPPPPVTRAKPGAVRRA
jgi:hypothetical protein